MEVVVDSKYADTEKAGSRELYRRLLNLHSGEKEVLGLNKHFFNRSTALAGLGLLAVKVPLSHSEPQHSVRLLWTSDRPVAETSTW